MAENQITIDGIEFTWTPFHLTGHGKMLDHACLRLTAEEWARVRDHFICFYLETVDDYFDKKVARAKMDVYFERMEAKPSIWQRFVTWIRL